MALVNRTPLRRLVPLRRTGAIKRRARPTKDRVQPSERTLVINRDRICFLARINAEHQCRNQWGDPHSPRDLLQLTVEHFWHFGAVKGKRAPSDRYHMVAMCGGGNVGAPSAEARDAMRSYVRKQYPDWEVTDEPAG